MVSCHSPSSNEKKQPSLENCSQADILKRCRLDPLYLYFPRLHITNLHQSKVFSFFISSSNIILKIQSWAWRWNMSPSKVAPVTDEWICEAAANSVLLSSKSPSMQRVIFSAKHPRCQLTSVGSASTPLVRNAYQKITELANYKICCYYYDGGFL